MEGSREHVIAGHAVKAAPVMRAAWPLSLKRCRMLLPPSPVLTVSPCCTCLADHKITVSIQSVHDQSSTTSRAASGAGCTMIYRA